MWSFSVSRFCGLMRLPPGGMKFNKLNKLNKWNEFNKLNELIGIWARGLSFSSPLYNLGGKDLYIQHEDNDTMSHLKKRPEYAPTLFCPQRVQEELEAKRAVFHPAALEFWNTALGEDLKPLEDEIHCEVISEVVQALPSFSDASIKLVLAGMLKFPWGTSPKHPNFMRLWKGLDDECYRRMKGGEWTFEEIFEVDDAFCRQGLQRFAGCHWFMIKKCFRKCERLNKTQFVRFMFGLNQTRAIHESISTYELEFNLKRLIEELNADELAAVSLAFFKTSTPIRDRELLFRVLEKVTENVGRMHTVGIAAVAKMARLSSMFQCEEHLLRFMEACIPHLDRLTPTTIVHLVLMGTNQTNVFHPELARLAVERFEGSLKTLRLKEMERIGLWMSMLNIPGDNLLRLILKEVQDPGRQNEIEVFGRCLPALLHYLTFRELFDEELISHVLSKEFQRKFLDKTSNQQKRESLSLDMTTQIELPNYKGNRLIDRTRNFLLKNSTLWVSTEKKTRPSLYQVILDSVSETLEENFGKKPLMTSVLPHFHVIEVLFCTDKQGKPVEMPPYLRDSAQWEPKILPKSALLTPIVFHSFIVMTKTVLIYNTKDVVGNVLLRERQMRKLGYQTHRIYSEEWQDAPTGKRVATLKNLMEKGCQESIRADEEMVQGTQVRDSV